ncbi:winged helix DNA-binding domain-containing protein [Dietzia psychralcaliphila]|uniref:winged helix DNA-binding domain-containing protein n=1 Tax=Dietzia psychralcaliphila TaxID=139021 RepID=UPI001C1E3E0D|nr:winged helix DNA-binding domain-containing protein [Dietzia psychralcaliphila]
MREASGPTPITRRDLARFRLASQRLVGERCTSPAEAVRWMACVQGQDLPGALESVALRSLGPAGTPATITDVRAALADGSVVRSWPMRGTLHLVPGEDLGWMVRLAAGRSRSAQVARLAALGVDDDEIDRAHRVLMEEVAGTRVRSRKQLQERWRAEGLDVSGGRGYHLLYLFVVDGLVSQVDCTGSGCTDSGGTGSGGVVHGFAHHERWLAAHGITPRTPTRDQAVAEWLERFLRSHGPARAEDFRRWTTLPLRDIRPALEAVSERLEAVSFDGATYWMDPGAADRLATAGRSADAVLLLPGFDEYLLGYGDRSHAVAPDHAQLIVPGNNGVFRRTVVHRAHVIATWKTVGSGARRRIEAAPFAPLTKAQSTGIDRAYRRHPT